MTIRVIGLSPSPRDREILDIPELPWDRIWPDTGYGDYAQILLPEPMATDMAQQTVRARLAHQESPSFPLWISGSSFGQLGIVPAELLGVLRTGDSRRIVYSADEQSLVLARTGYNGFRLYARSIDDVMILHRSLREQGIETIAKVQEIERVRVLDRGLTRLFWLVAVVGIVGGIAALVASLYAAVERKKRDLSMMRLLGLSRFDVSRFPIYQSATIAALAAVLAILGFFALAAVINTVFSADLGLGERICQLPPSTLLIIFVISVTVSVLSSLFAALRTTRIEPGEAIRVE